MHNIYKTTVNNPYHLSVGCILLNTEDKVVCHKHNHEKLGEIYTLMRESVEPNESCEQTIARGLMEEMGAEADIISYLGSITANDTWFKEINQPTTVQKTTVYFLARLTNIDESKRLKEDTESDSEIVNLEGQELISLMKAQSIRTGIQDINESSIVENMRKYLKTIQNISI